MYAIAPTQTYPPNYAQLDRRSSFDYSQQLPSNLESALKKSLPKAPDRVIRFLASKLPKPVLENFVAGEFTEGLNQSLQEVCTQLFPKGLIGALMRKTLKILGDEAALEIPEYGTVYLAPTVSSGATARPLARMFDIPHFELLGMRMYEHEQNLNQLVEVGTINKKQVFISDDLVGRLAVAKLTNFLMTTGTCMALELMVPSFRVLFSKYILGTANFSNISGLTKDQNDPGENNGSVATAKKNIWMALKYIALSIPAFFLAATGLSRIPALKNSHLIRQSARIFDLSSRFGLSKIMIAFILLSGIYSYLSVARSESEVLEIRDRILFFAIPSVLFYKQMAGNLFGFLNGLRFGIKQPLSGDYFKEVKSGKRDPFDLGFVDLQYDKQKKVFTGELLNKPEVLKLKLANPERYEKFKRSMYFAKEPAVYWGAFGIGIIIGWLNYKRTERLYHASHSGLTGATPDKVPPNPSPLPNVPNPANGIVNFNRPGQNTSSDDERKDNQIPQVA